MTGVVDEMIEVLGDLIRVEKRLAFLCRIDDSSQSMRFMRARTVLQRRALEDRLDRLPEFWR